MPPMRATVLSWGLDITTVPEVSTGLYSVALLLAAVALAEWQRRRRSGNADCENAEN